MPEPPPLRPILRTWFRMLGLTRQTPEAWHRARLREELVERRRARTAFWPHVSETADVLFCVRRAQYDGYGAVGARLPSAVFRSPSGRLATAYMLTKYTSRWAFYRVLVRLCGRPHLGREAKVVREVVNPAKDAKLAVVAARHGIDAVAFVRMGQKLRKVWPFLP
ncbi:hypothetical protein SPI_01973 [Niveomyces insectorum RCEF 264]|uniref:Uncharacterized protein n=1 Tax=Niveomyces insectorum RCEF 264 TaxID=1081102 RepID=A0A167XNF4_9HYPO|nr:hypothetical protein SPI_01973 [Niveomyces insectorum RCEF 264]